MPVKGTYLLAAGGGLVLLWSGFTGKNWSQVLKAVISGKDPRSVAAAYPIQTAPSAFAYGGPAVAATGTASGTGSSIANDAQRYIGAGYVWGGAPGSGAGHWDCSSFCNAVIGRDLGMAIPLYKPGTYHGQAHGPATVTWLVWTGAFNIPRASAAAGDLAVWQTHMGIFVNNQEIVSALDQKLGTQQTSVTAAAPFGEKLFCKRLKGATSIPGRP